MIYCTWKMFEEVECCIQLIFFQDRSNSYDSMRFTNFENQLLDIMRNSGDHADLLKGQWPIPESKTQSCWTCQVVSVLWPQNFPPTQTHTLLSLLLLITHRGDCGCIKSQMLPPPPQNFIQFKTFTVLRTTESSNWMI